MMIINRIFITVFLLSIAGTIVGSTFLAMQSFLYKHTSAEFMVKINKIVFFAFVIPFFYIWGLVDRTNEYLTQNDVLVIVEQGTLKKAVYSLKETIGFADKISLFWLVGLGIYLLIYVVNYAVFVNRIRKQTWEIETGIWREQFHTLCWSNGLQEERIRLAASSGQQQVCTVGVFHKTILVPEYLLEKLNESETGIILRHELTHVRKNDVPLKIGMFMLCNLNWFNPLVYYLNEVLAEWIELSCDEEMLAFADSSYKHEYVNALIKVMEEQREQDELSGHKSAAYFQDGKSLKCIKRRLNGIMKKKNVKKAAQVLALSSICCATVCGTALARDLEYPVNEILSNHAAVFEEETFFMADKLEDNTGYNFVSFNSDAMETVSVLSDDAEYEVVYEDGTRKAFAEQADQERAHTHKYVDTNVKKHVKKSDGSCVVTTYAATECTVCGKMTIGKMLSTDTFNPCRH